MVQCIFNVASTEKKSTQVLNLTPYSFYFNSIREMIEFLRIEMQTIFNIAEDSHYLKSSMAIFMTIIVDYGETYHQRSFKIMCKKVREYQIILKKSAKKS